MKKLWLLNIAALLSLTGLGSVAVYRQMLEAEKELRSSIVARITSDSDSLALVGRVISVSSRGDLRPNDELVLSLLNQFVLKEPSFKRIYLMNSSGEIMQRNSYDSSGLYLNEASESTWGDLGFETMETGKYGTVGVGFLDSANELVIRKWLDVDDKRFGSLVLIVDAAGLVRSARRDSSADGIQVFFSNARDASNCSQIAGRFSICSDHFEAWQSIGPIRYFVSFLGIGLGVYVLALFMTFILIIPLRKIVIALKDNRERPRLDPDKFLGPLKPVASLLNEYVDLQEQNSTLRIETEKSRAVEEVARQVAHDIRSPLTALRLAFQGFDGLPPERVKVIEGAEARIRAIANDLLKKGNFAPGSRFGIGAPSYGQALKPVPVSRVVRSIFEEKMVSMMGRSDIEFVLDIGRLDGAVCRIDENQLMRAISNLVNNAVESIQSAGRVTIAMRPSLKKNLAIIISDTGRGIPEDVLARLGKERISFGKVGGESGSGLGFYHATHVIHGMGGKLTIQSRVGFGTMVTITLPRFDYGGASEIRSGHETVPFQRL